jgi:formate hydrogenlyase subunit 6/NADH:ubiquinone oxidoreductase subunit I
MVATTPHTSVAPALGVPCVIERAAFPALLAALRARGYELIGPTVRDNAIVYDRIAGVEDLPAGWTDEQAGGHYRLQRRADAALFGYSVGPQSWKQFLYPPVLRLWRGTRTETGFTVVPETDEPPQRALIGVRACELHAIAIQDRVLLQGPYVDPAYAARREKLFIVAVNCGQAGGTCFCVSMQTGPQATFGYDLALTEVLDGARHYFVVESGTERGASVLADVPHVRADVAEQAAATAAVAAATAQMGRTLDTDGLKDLLYRNTENPRWDMVAQRCLNCANCTMVCPTCFCTTVEEVTDLTGEHAERQRRWDSCFTTDFSYIHGGSVRPTPKARYRQWMTHKLATWVDQFGTAGCVGCGRCITWCPVGIDITEEARAIRESEGVAPVPPGGRQ